jgi:tRNA-dihydrouridine synthase
VRNAQCAGEEGDLHLQLTNYNLQEEVGGVNEGSREYGKLSDIIFHIDMLSYLPEHIVVNEMKKHIAHYLKFRAGRAKFLTAINRVTTVNQMKEQLKDFFCAPE